MNRFISRAAEGVRAGTVGRSPGSVKAARDGKMGTGCNSV
jgi:hypothetical protein